MTAAAVLCMVWPLTRRVRRAPRREPGRRLLSGPDRRSRRRRARAACCPPTTRPEPGPSWAAACSVRVAGREADGRRGAAGPAALMASPSRRCCLVPSHRRSALYCKVGSPDYPDQPLAAALPSAGEDIAAAVAASRGASRQPSGRRARLRDARADLHADRALSHAAATPMRRRCGSSATRRSGSGLRPGAGHGGGRGRDRAGARRLRSSR